MKREFSRMIYSNDCWRFQMMTYQIILMQVRSLDKIILFLIYFQYYITHHIISLILFNLLLFVLGPFTWKDNGRFDFTLPPSARFHFPKTPNMGKIKVKVLITRKLLLSSGLCLPKI